MTIPAETSPGPKATGLRKAIAFGALLLVPCCSLDRALTLELTREPGSAGSSAAYASSGVGGVAGFSGVTVGSGVLAAGGGSDSDAGAHASGGDGTAPGGAGGAPTTSTPTTTGPKTSPFCRFAWGRHWEASRTDDSHDSRPPPLTSSDFFGAITGWETQNKLDADILRMLTAISPNNSGPLRGKMPVIYAPIIPLRAKSDAQLRDCGPESTTPNLCTHGAEWIRNHRDELRALYHDYAYDLEQSWPTGEPVIWLFEPRFSDYVRSSQTAPLSLQELSIVASDLIGAVRSRLKNVLIGHHAAPDIPDLAEYFGALDLSLVDLVYVSGSATSTRFGLSPQDSGEQATYSNLHGSTGLPIFVDTGFGTSTITNHGWLSSDPGPINARIVDGVFAVYVDPAPDDMDQRIDGLRSRVANPDCGRY